MATTGDDESQPLLPPPRTRRPTHVHRLTTAREGDSSVEKLAAKIEEREKNRIPITLLVQIQLQFECQEIADNSGYEPNTKITREDLISLRDRYAQDVSNQIRNPWIPCIPIIFGIKTFHLYMLRALDSAILHTNTHNEKWFHYSEWTMYHTRLESKWPWMRNKETNSVLVVLVFFIATPIYFCTVLGDKNICTDHRDIDWLNGFYIASVTLSTVGYGDMTPLNDSPAVGSIYMILSICVSILAFSAAAGQSWLDFERLFKYNTKDVAKDAVLSVRLVAIGLIKFAEVAVMFIILNLLGVIASRFFHGNLSSLERGSEWTWSESIYWSIQTTTTIGYGDMVMSDEMRLFQVFYLCLGTFFVGNTLGKLANLKDEMDEIGKLYAWEQREVTKEMIRTDQGDDGDPHVDQYEFVVASLLNLGKIDSDDLRPIMNKFRRLATSQGDEGYIDLDPHRRSQHLSK